MIEAPNLGAFLSESHCDLSFIYRMRDHFINQTRLRNIFHKRFMTDKRRAAVKVLALVVTFFGFVRKLA